MVDQAEQREWMQAPGDQIGNIRWQEKGWKSAWKDPLDWATQAKPAFMEHLNAAEQRLAHALATDHPSSASVHNARSFVNRQYYLLYEQFSQRYKDAR